MKIKPIRTPEDHARALKEIQRLWDSAVPGTAEGDAFEVLGTLVDAYERANFPMPAPDPIEAIRFRMEQAGLQAKDLGSILGTSRARPSEVLGKRRHLTLRMIRRLHDKLAIPLEVLVKEYRLKTARKSSSRKRKAA